MSKSKQATQSLIGQHVLDLPPVPENPRNSEGDFVTLADGKVLFAYTRFTGGANDAAAAVIASRVSDDGGQTWSDEDHVLVDNEGGQNVMSVSMLRLHDGRIALFYLRKNAVDDCRLYMRISEDEAATFSEPRPAISAPGYFVVNNDRVIQLSTGRLIVPASFKMHRPTAPRASVGIARFFYSDDAGETWLEGQEWWALPVPSTSGLQEPGVVELRDGRLWSWSRTTTGCQWAMHSHDGGDTWSPPHPTEFRSPNSPMSVKRLGADGPLLAIWNDRSDRVNHWGLPRPGSISRERTPLACAVSHDDATTWTDHRLIESDPEHGYAYIAVHILDDAVLLGYCAGGPDDGGNLNRLRLRRIPLSELV